MSLLVVLVLATVSARVESVSLAVVDSRLAVRVRLSGAPGMIRVHREGDRARVSVGNADLGLAFAGGRRFSWTPGGAFAPQAPADGGAKLDRLDLEATPSEVSVLLHVSPDVSVDVRRDARGLLLVCRPVPVAPELLVAAAAPSPPAAAPIRTPPPAGTGPAAPAPAPPAADTAELARRLFAVAPAEAKDAGTSSVAELYPRLFPTGAPQTRPQEAAPIDLVEPGPEAGVPLGPFRVRAGLDARYVDADTFVESTATPTRDRFLEVQPRVEAAAPVGEGRLTLDYAPVFRAFATYDDVNSSSHALGAGLDLTMGSRVTLRAQDRFRSGVLDTRVVDPGGEYFFGLGHFRRNDFDAGANIQVGPRLSLKLDGGLGAVRFQEESTFFDYDTRRARAGLGFELTPNLKAVASYSYDTVPRPDERPEAEATAHSGELALNGEIFPLLAGNVAVGYRKQESPGAGPGGTSYSGLTMSASLVRELGRESTAGVFASRSTPVSAYEQNAFYVSTVLQGTLHLPLPARVELRGGLGYQWNDYRTVSSAIGRPREDRILGWYVGVRRPVRENLFLGGSYRSEHRTSNVDGFDTDSDGFYVQLEWDVVGSPPR